MNLPNAITLGRLLAVPLLVWLILSRFDAWAFWLFVAAGVSDALDGLIAKRFHMVTDIGRYLDPIADKVLIVSVYLALGHTDQVPAWLVILVVSRDILIVGGAILAHTLGVTMRIQPLWISKINTGAQMVLVVLVMAETTVSRTTDLEAAELGLWIVVAATTLLSGSSYLLRWVERLRQYAGESK